MRSGLLALLALSLISISTLAISSVNANYRLPSTASDTWPTGSNNYGLVNGLKIGDVDSDGSTELLTAGTLYNGSFWAELRIYNVHSGSLVLEGSQLWARPNSLFSTLASVEAGDVDGDGLTETVVVGNSQGPNASQSHLGIFRWTGSSLVKEQLYNFTGPSYSIETRGVALWAKTGIVHIVTIGYYDNGSGNGYSQLGIWSWDNSVFTKKALYNWTATGGSGASSQGYGVATGDVDLDGTPDIVTVGVSSNGTSASTQLRVWNWDGSSLNPKQTREWLTFGQYSTGKSVSIKDLNGDNSPEIIVGGETYDSPFTKAELTVWSDTTGSLTQLSETNWLSSTLSTEEHFVVSVADVDGDGVQEIVTGGYTSMIPGGDYGTITTWSWRGSSTLLEKSYHTSTTDTRFLAIALGDLTGDGKQEIVVAGQKLGKSIVQIHNVAFVYGSIAISIDPSQVLSGQSVTISGTLSNQTDSAPFSSAQMQLEYSRDGGSYQTVAIIMTDSQGRFATSYTPVGPGSYVVRATWAGDEEHMGASATANLTVNKAPSVITLSSSIVTGKPGDTVTVNGYLYPAKSETITITYTDPSGTAVTHTVTSDSTGAFSDQNTISSAGEWKISASWAGTADTSGTSSNAVRVQAQPDPVGLTLSPYGFGIGLLALALAVVGLMRKSRGPAALPTVSQTVLQPAPVKAGESEKNSVPAQAPSADPNKPNTVPASPAEPATSAETKKP